MVFSRKVNAEIFQFFFQIVRWERQFSELAQLSSVILVFLTRSLTLSDSYY